MFVLGTAGHVDHGKSTLLKALTGQEPDRLPEEKKRGMTIDLNFVWCELPDVGTVGIVDVPGHQKFVGNLVAGLSSIDAFIFVVAADDGWMPQSQEHLNLLKGLKVERGIVVMTKTDLVESARLSEVIEEVESKFSTAGISVRMERFSALDPSSIAGVRSALGKLVSDLPRPTGTGAAHLWIDRVFVPKGKGTVVTGTLRGGELKVGSEVQLYPSGAKVCVRGLQSHGQEKERAVPNCRLAIQLGAGDVSAVRRGELLSTARDLCLSNAVEVILYPEGKFAPKRSVKVGFHIGTLAVPAQFTPLTPVEGGWAGRLKFSKKIPINALDRFVLRTSGEEKTIGCGVIIDIAAGWVKLSHARAKLSERALTASGLLQYLLQTHRVLEPSQVPKLPETESFLRLNAVAVNGRFFDKALWMEALSVLEPQLSEKELVAKLGVTKSVAIALFNSLEVKKLITRESGKIRRVSSDFNDDEGLKFVQQWLPGLTPIPLSAQLKDPQTKDLMQKLIRDHKIIRLAEDHFLSASAYALHSQTVQAHLKKKGAGTTSELKDLLGFSRKLSVMILERMDSDRMTYLKEGVRKLLKA